MEVCERKGKKFFVLVLLLLVIIIIHIYYLLYRVSHIYTFDTPLSNQLIYKNIRERDTPLFLWERKIKSEVIVHQGFK